MKNLKLTVFTLILSATTAFAQTGNPDISGKVVLTELKKDVKNTDDNKTYETQHLEITEEYTPVMLDPKDKHKLNQDIVYMPTQVTKKIKLDIDGDTSYDKKAEFSYTKPDNFDLEFTLTKNGVIILTDQGNLYVSSIWDKNSKVKYSNVKTDRIKREGTYTVKLSNEKEIDITISNYDIY